MYLLLQGYYHCNSALVLLKSGILMFNSSYSSEVLLNVREKDTPTLVITVIFLIVLAAFAIAVTCFK